MRAEEVRLKVEMDVTTAERRVIQKAGFIAQELSRYKIKINKNRNKYRSIIEDFKKQCTKKYGIKIEYLEARNIGKLTKNIIGKKFKLFIAYYINKVRLIDNF